LNSGASLWEQHLLIYGARTAVLNADTGEVVWSFDPARVRRFPVSLHGPGESPPKERPPAYAPAWGRTPNPQRPPWISGPVYARQGGYVSVTSYQHAISFSSGRRLYLPPPYYPPTTSSGSYSSRPSSPRYVNYLRPDSPGALLQQRSTRLALVAPGVRWAASHAIETFVARLGVVYGDRLLLFGSDELLVSPLELPLGGLSLAVSGTFVGMAGRNACMLTADSLVTLDVVDGTIDSYRLSELTEGKKDARIQAVVDGPLVYRLGPGGILCVNPRTARRIFKAPWPEAAGFKEVGLVNESPIGPYVLQGVATSGSERYGDTLLPLACCAGKGVLYVAVTPTRVVALVNADGRTE
jgi:hypothetical protein